MRTRMKMRMIGAIWGYGEAYDDVWFEESVGGDFLGVDHHVVCYFGDVDVFLGAWGDA
jgi:hypothetical protein